MSANNFNNLHPGTHQVKLPILSKLLAIYNQPTKGQQHVHQLNKYSFIHLEILKIP